MLPQEPTDPVADRIQTAAEQLGTNPLIDWAVRLLSGQSRPGDAADPDITLLGGMEALEDWMARVWAAQVLLHRWHHAAEPAVAQGLEDEVWQVRTVCLEVAALRKLTALEPHVSHMVDDPAPQVRSSAAQTLGELGSVNSSDTVTVLGEAVMSPDSVVADAAERALERLAERFDRPDIRTASRY